MERPGEPRHADRGIRGRLFLVGRCGKLPAVGRSGRDRALVDAALARRPIPSSAAIFPALVLAPDRLRPCCLCGWFGAQRLRHSFWDDEVYAMRRAIHGQWKRNDDGSIRFRPVSWQETFWFFEKPQHQLHSIVTRVVLDVWRGVAKPEG